MKRSPYSEQCMRLVDRELQADYADYATKRSGKPAITSMPPRCLSTRRRKRPDTAANQEFPTIREGLGVRRPWDGYAAGPSVTETMFNAVRPPRRGRIKELAGALEQGRPTS